MILINISVFFETYGCQMNVSDTEIAWSILDSKGYKRSEDVNNVNNTYYINYYINYNTKY